MAKKYDYDCGCGLTDAEIKETIKIKPYNPAEWNGLHCSPSGKRKCRTCGKKFRGGYRRLIAE